MKKPVIVVQAFQPSTVEAEAGRSLNAKLARATERVTDTETFDVCTEGT